MVLIIAVSQNFIYQLFFITILGKCYNFSFILELSREYECLPQGELQKSVMKKN